MNKVSPLKQESSDRRVCGRPNRYELNDNDADWEKKDVVKSKESNVLPKVKKEKKVFETADAEVKTVLKDGRPKYYTHIKEEKLIFKNRLPSDRLNKILPSDDLDNWKQSFETKVEKETKDKIKTILKNSTKRLHPGLNDSEKVLVLEKKFKPLIELVPPVIKQEKPEIHILKKTRAEPIVEIMEEETHDKVISFTPSLREVITKNNPIFTFKIPQHLDARFSTSIAHDSTTIQKVLENHVDTNPFKVGLSTSEDTCPLREGPDRSSIQSPETLGGGPVEMALLTEATVESTQQPRRRIGSQEDNSLDEANRDVTESEDQRSNELNTCLGEAPENITALKSSHEILERSGPNLLEKNGKNVNASESNDQPVLQDTPGPTSSKQHAKLKPKETTMSPLSSEIVSDKIIKVKPPQILGIKGRENLQDSKNVDLDISYLNQIQLSAENKTKISEICKLYPIFFTSRMRRYIGVLIKMIYEASQKIDDLQHCDDIKKCSKTFVKRFKKILQFDQIGSDKDMLKKVIPILYLHLDKGFAKLRPSKDFREVMRKMFIAESFVCEHDVILDRDEKIFKNIMSSFDRWLEGIFVECDVSECLEPSPVNIIDVEEDSINSCGNIIPEDISQESECNSLDRPQVQADSNVKAKTKEITVCGPEVEVNYLLCPICRESLPLCRICQELLSCPCLVENVVFDKGPGSLNLCAEHSACGDNWPEWEQSWTENDDGNTPLNAICWNTSCNNTATWLCICRTQAYCSRTCQVEDWQMEHSQNCRRQSDPRCLAQKNIDMEIDIT